MFKIKLDKRKNKLLNILDGIISLVDSLIVIITFGFIQSDLRFNFKFWRIKSDNNS